MDDFTPDQIADLLETTKRMAKTVPGSRYAAMRLEDFKPGRADEVKALEAAQSFLEAIPWLDDEAAIKNLLLLGKPGTGKTHLAVGILHAAIKDEVDYCFPRLHAFVGWHDLVSEAAEAAKARKPLSAALGRYIAAEILVLDDIRLPRSAADVEALDVLIEHRYRHKCRPLVITSNLGLQQLHEALGTRSFDRAREAAQIVTLAGVSHRARQHTSES